MRPPGLNIPEEGEQKNLVWYLHYLRVEGKTTMMTLMF